MGTIVEEKGPPVTGESTSSRVPSDPLAVMREVLEIQKQGNPTLDIGAQLDYAVANPDQEVVDSLGAVSVVCVLYGAYKPQSLIPAPLLTHRNFTTLNGLKKVLDALNKNRGRT